MREFRSPGSVRGAARKGRPYRDSRTCGLERWVARGLRTSGTHHILSVSSPTWARKNSSLTSRHYRGTYMPMRIATSRITAQGQISVPYEVRRRLGVSPGSTIEWDVEDDKVVVKRTGKYTFEDVHRVLFPDGPPKPRTLQQLKEGIAGYIRSKHARR